MNFEKINQLQKQLEEVYKQLNDELEEAKSALLNERNNLLTEQREWNELAMKFNTTLLPNIIKLNVCGKLFATSKNTLLAQKNSFFEGMFGGRFNLQAEEDGSYFIDRNPFVFDIVLDYMRSNKVNLERLSVDKIDALFDDAQFYQLQPLIDILNLYKHQKENNIIFYPGPNYVLSENYTRASKNLPNYAWDTVVKGAELPMKGIFRWKIAIIKSQSSNIMIGVAPNSIDQNVTDQYLKCGFYLYTVSSRLYSGPPFSYNTYKTGEYGVKGRTNEGEEVGVQVNMDDHTVEYFDNNGISLGIAYDNIPVHTPLCITVLLFTPNDVVEVRAWNCLS